MTLHSAFNFPFNNQFLSLPDKLRDKKRDQLKLLKMIIIDEFSMLKADMLYQIDLRLRELMEASKEAFGGCAVLLFGDILQLKPVMGKYVFDLPISSDYHASFYIESLWNTFRVIHLLTNHRQGEDHVYADLLNRVRTGSQNENDITLLQERVRPLNHPDIPKDALFVTCTNKDVNTINNTKLEEVQEQLIEIPAQICSSKHPMMVLFSTLPFKSIYN
ncbi:ATP-dependent DNA helicase pif1-like [Antedon mediterranea]|uniref:ATP-dependent DNA helicase pif1-like n=1 Tax=Antedon mediterranea TaxID=105859 RepID=UPI003AF64159